MEEQESRESQLRRAYHIGLQLKNTKLEKDIIYARIEKQSIDPDIAMQVAEDIELERRKDFKNEESPRFEMAIGKVIIGVVFSIVIYIVFPGYVYVPVLLILGSAIYAFYSYNKMNKD